MGDVILNFIDTLQERRALLCIVGHSSNFFLHSHLLQIAHGEVLIEEARNEHMTSWHDQNIQKFVLKCLKPMKAILPEIFEMWLRVQLEPWPPCHQLHDCHGFSGLLGSHEGPDEVTNMSQTWAKPVLYRKRYAPTHTHTQNTSWSRSPSSASLSRPQCVAACQSFTKYPKQTAHAGYTDSWI